MSLALQKSIYFVADQSAKSDLINTLSSWKVERLESFSQHFEHKLMPLFLFKIFQKWEICAFWYARLDVKKQIRHDVFRFIYFQKEVRVSLVLYNLK